jgi:NAD(P)-dependent dehydrogenase (short-subunit alcohol dehydrogenase family)
VDLTDWEATVSALSALPTMHGVVNNAAVAVLSSFLETKPEDFDRYSFTYNKKKKRL